MGSGEYCEYCCLTVHRAEGCGRCGPDAPGVHVANPEGYLPAGTLLRRRYQVGRLLGNTGRSALYFGVDRDRGLRITIEENFPVLYARRADDGYRLVALEKPGAAEAFALSKRNFHALEVDESATDPELPGVTFEENGSVYRVRDQRPGGWLAETIDDVDGPGSPFEATLTVSSLLKDLTSFTAPAKPNKSGAPLIEEFQIESPVIRPEMLAEHALHLEDSSDPIFSDAELSAAAAMPMPKIKQSDPPFGGIELPKTNGATGKTNGNAHSYSAAPNGTATAPPAPGVESTAHPPRDAKKERKPRNWGRVAALLIVVAIAAAVSYAVIVMRPWSALPGAAQATEKLVVGNRYRVDVYVEPSGATRQKVTLEGGAYEFENPAWRVLLENPDARVDLQYAASLSTSLLFVGQFREAVWALNLEDGSERWSYGDHLASNLKLISSRLVYLDCVTQEGQSRFTVVARDLANGRMLKQAPLVTQAECPGVSSSIPAEVVEFPEILVVTIPRSDAGDSWALLGLDRDNFATRWEKGINRRIEKIERQDRRLNIHLAGDGGKAESLLLRAGDGSFFLN
ncbi:MAG: hypothetical protein H6684_12870 [Deltaproteobacteria bacterium]|nr:hypothetical protein [Deltaproteobacteria bacterium]MCB9479499.1 hypothetical protein [Deltaproteobacteria bacterium]MCB9489617.1 hypothetical protein [Deltaproteobacteria bacterium]